MANLSKKLLHQSRVCALFQIGLFVFFVFNSTAIAEENNNLDGAIQAKTVQMLAPENNGMVISKKPLIECIIKIPFAKESLYIEFDMTDISTLVKLDGNKFRFRPVQVVPPGNHQLMVSFNDENGEQIVEQFQFVSRHSKFFETAYSRNKVSGGYTRVLKKYQDAKTKKMLTWQAEANLSTENLLSRGPLSFNFKANGRYHDQEDSVEEPLGDPFELVDFLFTGKYEKDKYMLGTSVGDLLINESRNTVNNLSRRGGNLVASYGKAGLSGFVVRSDQIYGSDGNYGLRLDNDNHIIGISSSLDLLDKKTTIKAIYITGGTRADDDTFGTWNKTGGTKGHVKGIVVKTDFFNQKFATTFEYDKSNYDGDLSDSLKSKSDKAYFLQAEGNIKKFIYSAEYEYTGRNYQVPGNNTIRSDWKGYTLRTSLNFEKHMLGLSYAKHNDDIDKKDSVRGQTEYTDYIFDYGLNAFESVPMTFSWTHNIVKNHDSIIDNYTDTYSSNLSYTKDSFSLSFTPSYSKTNDKTTENNDSSNLCLNLSGSYSKEIFSIQPGIGFNRYKEYLTNVYTDTDTYSLTIALAVIKNFSINNTGTISYTNSSDNTIDQDCIANELQFTYEHPGRFWGIFSPRASLCTNYSKTKDRIQKTDTEETIVYVTLSGDFELSF